MDNVNDLLNTTPTQTISLNTLKNNNGTPSINIDATNKDAMQNQSSNTNNVSISFSANRLKRRTRISADQAANPVTEVNPNDIIPTKVEEAGPNVREIALGQLDAAVKRKKDEYNQFIEKALEMDKENRIKIDAGLEKIEGEVDYIPPQVEEEIKKQEEEAKKGPTNDIPSRPIDESTEEDNVENNTQEDYKFYDDEEKEFFDEDDNELENFEAPQTTIVNTNKLDEIETNNDDEFEGDTPEPTPVHEENNVMIKDPLLEKNAAQTIIDSEPKTITTDDGVTIDMPTFVDKIPDEVVNDIPVTEPTEHDIQVVEVKTDLASIVDNIPVEDSKKEEKKSDDGTEEFMNAITKGSLEVKSNVIESIEDNAKNTSSNDFNIDDADFEDVTTQADAGEVQLTDDQIKEIRAASEKNLRSEILKKVINTSNRLNTSSFAVSSKVVSIKDALKRSSKKEERTGSYPMMYAGRPFKATTLKGPEIALLADTDDSGSENSVGLTMEQCRIMYEHDANPYKPKTVEAWAKTIPFGDVESIFAALYIASLKGANYVPMMCPKQACQYSFLSDDIKIEQMIKFKNDDIKKRFEEVSNTALTPDNTGSYESVICPINDEFAVGLKVPSIYTILYEYASLNAAFVRKYISIVSIMQYIDYIYFINPETNQYQPVGWKIYPGDNAKSFRSKIATYARIIKEFDETEFSILTALINSMINKNRDTKDIEYEIPAGKCSKCGADIEARPIFPREMVFMRQRLVALATIRTER